MIVCSDIFFSTKNRRNCACVRLPAVLTQFSFICSVIKKYSLSEEDFIKKESEVCSEEKSNNDNFNDEVLFNRDNKSYEGKILINKNKEELRKKLKQLRINFAIKEKLPPYCIFNDETLNDLLDKIPKNKEELMKVKGLAKVKINKYGEEILGVLN